MRKLLIFPFLTLFCCSSPKTMLDDPRLIDIPSFTHKYGFNILKLRYKPPLPSYPQTAKIEHIDGHVVIAAVFDEHGNAIFAKIIQGQSLIANPMINYVLNIKYYPLVLDGVPRAFKTKFDFDFGL